MGRQNYMHLVVNVEPFRMVIPFFRPDRSAGHPAERIGEIFELEVLFNRVAPLHHAPAIGEQRVQ